LTLADRLNYKCHFLHINNNSQRRQKITSCAALLGAHGDGFRRIMELHYRWLMYFDVSMCIIWMFVPAIIQYGMTLYLCTDCPWY
jgi:hypothetical protein